MLLYALAVLATQGADPPAVAPSDGIAAAPEITVEGKKPKMVCTASVPTGSRIGRGKRCVTPEQAEREAVQSRQAMEQRLALQRARQSIMCNGPSGNPICQ